MIRIAICDDDKTYCEKLKQRICETNLFVNPQFHCFDNGVDLLKEYQKGTRYDFVFLDIDMPQVTGIELGKKINVKDPDAIIIFVTSYSQYAIEAFDCHAFNYLLKDADDNRFDFVLLKAIKSYQKAHKSILITTKDGAFRIEISRIYYVECCQKHIIFHLKERQFSTKQTLREVYGLLAQHDFCQVHQGYIVNWEKAVSISAKNVVLDNGEKVMISVRKYREVLSSYSEYVKRSM